MKARNIPELALMASDQLSTFCRDVSCYTANALNMLRKAEDQLNADDMLTDKVADYLESAREDIRRVCHVMNEKV